eukprot:1135278-Amorphochlora_amoeboformis.AAC.1
MGFKPSHSLKWENNLKPALFLRPDEGQVTKSMSIKLMESHITPETGEGKHNSFHCASRGDAAPPQNCHCSGYLSQMLSPEICGVAAD